MLILYFPSEHLNIPHVYSTYIWNIGDKMVQAMIHVSEKANQILNIVKARFNLKDKSQAIERIAMEYGAAILEPALRPDYVEKMEKRQLEPTVRVSDFRKHFGMR